MTKSHEEASPNYDYIQKALSDAEVKSLKNGEKFTAPRKMVYKRLLEVGRPMKAYEILDTTDDNGKKSKPPTIYRALDFLTKSGLIHKIESDSSYFICSHSDVCEYSHHVPMVLICDNCKRVYEKHLVSVENIIKDAAVKSGFKIDKILLEAHGLCKLCSDLQQLP